MAYSVLWNDSFWLPEGASFSEFNRSGVTYSKPADLKLVPIFGLALYVLRLVFERFIALPIAKYHQVPDGAGRKPPESNEYLEKYYKHHTKQPSEAQIEGLSKKLEIPKSFLRRWFRRKRNWGRPSTEKKFCETSWRFVFYTGVFVYGLKYLWETPWFWNLDRCWTGFPHHNLDYQMYVYYIAEASFYTSLLLSVMTDVRRKDFSVQLIHHVATLGLILFSYVGNFVRIGTLVMLIHDVSDVFLEGAKCLFYLKYQDTSEGVFVVFAITFLVSRIIILPFWVLHSIGLRSVAILGSFHSLYFFIVQLGVLQCLHIYWASIIVKMAKQMMLPQPGKDLKDDRSDDDELSSEDENANTKKKN